MSIYYKQPFTSPEPTFALVKEELKSYFDTGAVDDTLFPIWVDKCLKKLGKASYPINQAFLCMSNFEARLPDDFHAVREAWACTQYTKTYQLPNSVFAPVKQVSTRVDHGDLFCRSCTECEFPDIIEAIYKTTNKVAFQFQKVTLLTPGNTYPACPDDLYCANYNSTSEKTYDVRDNKFVTNFRDGTVYVQYYSNEFDAENQLIPDVYKIKEFIETFLKEKIFEQLSNQATDESFNQISQKYAYYKQLADEKYIIADTENKKEDVYRKRRAIRRTDNRFKRYHIK